MENLTLEKLSGVYFQCLFGVGGLQECLSLGIHQFSWKKERYMLQFEAYDAIDSNGNVESIEVGLT